MRTLYIVDDVSLLNGMFISHLWFANDQDVLYSRRIINVKSSKVTVIYWVPNETEDDGEDEK